MLKICIDAYSLGYGGGYVHICEFLNSHIQHDCDIELIVCARADLLKKLPSGRNVKKINVLPDWISLKFFYPFFLKKFLRSEGVDVLFVPATNYPFSFKRVVAMPQNMLPFDKVERDRFKYSLRWLRYLILRRLQIRILNKSKHIIFLSEYAANAIRSELSHPVEYSIIPHGVNLKVPFKKKKPIPLPNITSNINLVYVSPITAYKHQWLVVEALSQLRHSYGLNITIDFIGGEIDNRSVKKFRRAINERDADGKWVRAFGALDHENLINSLANYDYAIFASSCENFPVTLLELMAARLPIIALDKMPNTEILESNAFFFALDVEEMATAVLNAISSPNLCDYFVKQNSDKLKLFSWDRNYLRIMDMILEVSKNGDR